MKSPAERHRLGCSDRPRYVSGETSNEAEVEMPAIGLHHAALGLGKGASQDEPGWPGRQLEDCKMVVKLLTPPSYDRPSAKPGQATAKPVNKDSSSWYFLEWLRYMQRSPASFAEPGRCGILRIVVATLSQASFPSAHLDRCSRDCLGIKTSTSSVDLNSGITLWTSACGDLKLVGTERTVAP